MGNKDSFTREELTSVRCLCIIGIVLSHSYIPGLYETGYLWRVPILFLLGGLSLIPTRKTTDTAIYVFKSFYMYTCISSAAYMAAVFFVYNGQPNKIISDYNFYSIFLTDIFKGNNHTNALILGSWFLIPYSISLLILTKSKKIIGKFKTIQLFIIFSSFILSLYLIESTVPSWKQRLIAQTSAAMGFMMLGYFTFTNRKTISFIKNGWTVALSTMGAFWIWSAFNRPGIVWSWMKGLGDAYWYSFLATILFIPAIFWIGTKFSNYKTVIMIGKNSKHIMVHHLFGFFLVNLCLSMLGYISLNDVHVFYIFKPKSLWPIYFMSGIMWSLAVSTSLETIKKLYQPRSHALAVT